MTGRAGLPVLAVPCLVALVACGVETDPPQTSVSPTFGPATSPVSPPAVSGAGAASSPDAAASPAASSSRVGRRGTAVVASVTDGDTFDVRTRGQVETVRLIGINAPESDECHADAATDALRRLVAGREVRLEKDESDRDRFGRLLRYVHTDGRFVNRVMVREGHAIARRYPPDVARADELDAAERRAKADGAGLWSRCLAADPPKGLSVRVHPDAPGDDSRNLNGEWATIANGGDVAVDLGGWTLRDESASHRFDFPAGTVLERGSSLRVYSGCGEDSETALYWCAQGSAIWNNDGDTASLLDRAGKTVVSYSYD